VQNGRSENLMAEEALEINHHPQCVWHGLEPRCARLLKMDTNVLAAVS